jgi:hypothetical protein
VVYVAPLAIDLLEISEEVRVYFLKEIGLSHEGGLD